MSRNCRGWFFLSDFQVKALADYIRKSGTVYTVYEIAAVPGFNASLAAMVAPFVMLGNEKQSEAKQLRLRNNILANFSVSILPLTLRHRRVMEDACKVQVQRGTILRSCDIRKRCRRKDLIPKTASNRFFSAGLVWKEKDLSVKVIAGDFGARYGMGTVINTGLRTGLSLTQTGYLSGGDEIQAIYFN
jgi:hypothetical protein